MDPLAPKFEFDASNDGQSWQEITDPLAIAALATAYAGGPIKFYKAGSNTYEPHCDPNHGILTQKNVATGVARRVRPTLRYKPLTPMFEFQDDSGAWQSVAITDAATNAALSGANTKCGPQQFSSIRNGQSFNYTAKEDETTGGARLLQVNTATGKPRKVRAAALIPRYEWMRNGKWEPISDRRLVGELSAMVMDTSSDVRQFARSPGGTPCTAQRIAPAPGMKPVAMTLALEDGVPTPVRMGASSHMPTFEFADTSESSGWKSVTDDAINAALYRAYTGQGRQSYSGGGNAYEASLDSDGGWVNQKNTKTGAVRRVRPLAWRMGGAAAAVVPVATPASPPVALPMATPVTVPVQGGGGGGFLSGVAGLFAAAPTPPKTPPATTPPPLGESNAKKMASLRMQRSMERMTTPRTTANQQAIKTWLLDNGNGIAKDVDADTYAQVSCRANPARS